MKKILSKYKMSQSMILKKDEASYYKIEQIFINICKYQKFLLEYLHKVHVTFGFEDKFNIVKSRLTYFIDENIWNVFKSKQSKIFRMLEKELNEILKNEEKMKVDLDEKMQQSKSFYELRFFYNEFKLKIFKIETSLKNLEVKIPQFIKYRYFKEVS